MGTVCGFESKPKEQNQSNAKKNKPPSKDPSRIY